MKEVIVLSPVCWQERKTRLEQLFARLTDSRVLFVQPADTGPQPPALSGPGHMHYASVRRLSGASRRLPPLLARRSRTDAAHLHRVMSTLGMVRPLLYVTQPCMLPLALRLEHSALIYDASYEMWPAPALFPAAKLKRWEQQLLEQAELVLTASSEKSEELGREGSVVIPNGVDFELFHRDSDELLPFPDDFFNIQNPIIGHVGTVDGGIDLGFAAAAAVAHPEWNFVFIGAVAPGTELGTLRALPNVHFLGEKPHRSLPSYLSRLDVCINLARGTAWGASPLKLYEYLATGKPIVSTPNPRQVMDYTEVLTIAATPEEFCEGLRRAVTEHDAWRRRQRVAYGRAASWDARARELEGHLTALYESRSGGTVV